MRTTLEALAAGFKKDPYGWVFRFSGDLDYFELRFEPLLFDDQMYVALYRNGLLLTEKVVVKPGKVKTND